MKYYEARFTEIIEHDVVRETDCYVWLAGGSREKKETEWRHWSRTFKGARDWLIKREEIKVSKAKDILEQRQKYLKRIKNITTAKRMEPMPGSGELEL